MTTSIGEKVPIQHTYRKTQNHLARQQRKLTRKNKESKRCKKQKNKIARIHQRIGRIRENFHYNTAHKLVKKFDLIAVEDLNIRGLARSKLAKSILDGAWGKFINILSAVAVKRGSRVVKVQPHGTSVNCSNCGTKVPKTLSIRVLIEAPVKISDLTGENVTSLNWDGNEKRMLHASFCLYHLLKLR